MFCYQCQEAAGNKGCTVRGVCGKNESTANLHDLLIHVVKGVGRYGEKASDMGLALDKEARFVMEALFATITNANFDDARISSLIREAVDVRDRLREKVAEAFQKKHGRELPQEEHDAALWQGKSMDEMSAKAIQVGVLATENEDIRSLRGLLIYGLKGICAYGDHAAVLGYREKDIDSFLMRALAATTKDLNIEEMIRWVVDCGTHGVKTMALLDRAHRETYGDPQMTRVNIGVRPNPGILISGHDMKDMEELLEQTRGTGVDVYTHCEMLPAHYYPAFRKYDHLAGNYGNSWWRQDKEFESFNGPILMTTNCVIPVKDSYKDRLFTTGMAGYPGCKHIGDRERNGQKDFSEIIEKARTCAAPNEIETGSITGGFAHHQVLALADRIVAAVEAGKIRRFVVMGGCDGRQKARSYFTEVAKSLPADAVIMTAGCAKYRYNKLDLGTIDGIPRVLDAGQCNDSYSLALVALTLKDVMGVKDINDLPIAYDIAWYEQKAIIVLLALLSLGVKGIRLGPTLPAFLSSNVATLLVEKFDLKPIGEAKKDVEAIVA